MGVNNYSVVERVGTYRGSIVVPPAGSGFRPLAVRVEASASVLAATDLLLLSGELVITDTQTDSDNIGGLRTELADLTWSWSCDQPTVDLSDPLQFARDSSLSSRQLLLTQEFRPLPAGTYVFTGHALDIDSRPGVDGQRRNASASVSVTVLPRVQEVQVPPSSSASPPTPCELTNPCLNRGVCSYVPSAGVDLATNDTQPARLVSLNGTEYALYCACAPASPQFFGADCSFSILTCAGCVARYDD